MPWKTGSVVNERMEFALKRERGERMTDLCREYGISRITGHKIYRRFKGVGLEGVMDQSRRPGVHPNTTPKEIEQLIVEERKKRLTWVSTATATSTATSTSTSTATSTSTSSFQPSRPRPQVRPQVRPQSRAHARNAPNPHLTNSLMRPRTWWTADRLR